MAVSSLPDASKPSEARALPPEQPSLDTLPAEVGARIVDHLDEASLVQMAQVSRSWRRQALDPRLPLASWLLLRDLFAPPDRVCPPPQAVGRLQAHLAPLGPRRDNLFARDGLWVANALLEKQGGEFFPAAQRPPPCPWDDLWQALEESSCSHASGYEELAAAMPPAAVHALFADAAPPVVSRLAALSLRLPAPQLAEWFAHEQQDAVAALLRQGRIRARVDGWSTEVSKVMACAYLDSQQELAARTGQLAFDDRLRAEGRRLWLFLPPHEAVDIWQLAQTMKSWPQNLPLLEDRLASLVTKAFGVDKMANWLLPDTIARAVPEQFIHNFLDRAAAQKSVRVRRTYQPLRG